MENRNDKLNITINFIIFLFESGSHMKTISYKIYYIYNIVETNMFLFFWILLISELRIMIKEY